MLLSSLIPCARVYVEIIKSQRIKEHKAISDRLTDRKSDRFLTPLMTNTAHDDWISFVSGEIFPFQRIVNGLIQGHLLGLVSDGSKPLFRDLCTSHL